MFGIVCLESRAVDSECPCCISIIVKKLLVSVVFFSYICMVIQCDFSSSEVSLRTISATVAKHCSLGGLCHLELYVGERIS